MRHEGQAQKDDTDVTNQRTRVAIDVIDQLFFDFLKKTCFDAKGQKKRKDYLNFKTLGDLCVTSAVLRQIFVLNLGKNVT